MIVVDTNVLAYLWLPGTQTQQAQQALQRDSEWVSPLLWRSEFRNVLAGYLRLERIEFDVALKVLDEAESQMAGTEYTVSSERVMHLIMQSSCSAYDCEFVALAQDLDIPLVTTDKMILSAFSDTAIALERFVNT